MATTSEPPVDIATGMQIDGSTSEKDVKIATTPNLDLCALKLDKVLSGNVPLSNPAKSVRRWLGFTSITVDKVKDMTLQSIVQCANSVLPVKSDIWNKIEVVVDKSENIEGSAKVGEMAKFEVELWLISLAVKACLNAGNAKLALEVSSLGIQLADSYIQVKQLSSSLFPLQARLFRFQNLAFISIYGNDSNQHNIYRASLQSSYRMAVHNSAHDTTSTIINLLLSSFIATRCIEQASQFLSVTSAAHHNSSSASGKGSNAQYVRFLFYSGYIAALRVNYSESYAALAQCQRKCQANSSSSDVVGVQETHKGVNGFVTSVNRLLIVVQLLLGDIPERSAFSPDLKEYLAVTQAVRRGDLNIFEQVVMQHSAAFNEHKTLSLIRRLSHSVLKAGLRRLVTSYSCIALSDVATRLGLNSGVTNVEFIVSKAIRDGVIDATLVHSSTNPNLVLLQSKDYNSNNSISYGSDNVYGTTLEPTEMYHRRIAYCLDLHNEAVRGLRYPKESPHQKKLMEARAASEARRNARKKSKNKRKNSKEEDDSSDDMSDDMSDDELDDDLL